MAKDPAFLFYPNDYIGGTMGMTFEEKGAYIELLMVQFNRGHMTSHMIGQTIGQLWDNIKDKFEVDTEGRFYNVRLEEEKEKRKAFTASRRNNKEGKNQHSSKGHNIGHTTSHMEDVNEDVNSNKEVPVFEDFKKYAITNKPNIDLEALNLKYKSWVEGGWINGNGKKIKNWKTSLLNTLPYMKESKPDQELSSIQRIKKLNGTL